MHPSTVRILRDFVFIVAVLLAFVAAASGQASKPPEPEDDQEQRIKELEEQVDRLNRETRDHEAGIDILKRYPLAQWKDGFIINSADNAYKLRISGYTHFDGRFFIDDDDDGDTNKFLFRRVRLSFDGTVARYFEFRIMPDFANSQLALFDAYTDIIYFPDFKLRIGKFKPPVGLERLESATALEFAERSLPTNLVPNRDLGVQLWGEPWNGQVTYAFGIFNGAQDGQNNDGDNTDDHQVDGLLERPGGRPRGERQRQAHQQCFNCDQPCQRPGVHRQPADDQWDREHRDRERDRRDERQREHERRCGDQDAEDEPLTLARAGTPRVKAIFDEGDNRTRGAPEPRRHPESLTAICPLGLE